MRNGSTPGEVPPTEVRKKQIDTHFILIAFNFEGEGIFLVRSESLCLFF